MCNFNGIKNFATISISLKICMMSFTRNVANTHKKHIDAINNFLFVIIINLFLTLIK